MNKNIVLLCLLTLLTSCVKSPPKDVDNVCRIFKQYPSWRKETQKVEKHWKVPVAVQMAIVHQESKFNGRAQPERTKLLWIIPWKRPSSAYGYSQALKSTWELYKKSEGGYWVSRDDFGDAVDFIGWYANQARQRAGIAADDAYRLYLAYHEGVTGFQQKTYLKKPWLIHVAQKVKARSQQFSAQLSRCPGSSSFSWF